MAIAGGPPQSFMQLTTAHMAPSCNPLDLVFNALRAIAPGPGALAPMPMLQERVTGLGLTREMLREALENWETLGLLVWPGRGTEVGLASEAWHTQVCHPHAGMPP